MKTVWTRIVNISVLFRKMLYNARIKRGHYVSNERDYIVKWKREFIEFDSVFLSMFLSIFLKHTF